MLVLVSGSGVPNNITNFSSLILKPNTTFNFQMLSSSIIYELYFARYPLAGFKPGSPTTNLEQIDALDRLAMDPLFYILKEFSKNNIQ